MNSEFLGVTFGLCSALCWGAGDFSGGVSSKRNNVFSVVLFSQLMGVALLVGLAMAFQEVVTDPYYLVWGGIGGIFGMLGLLALYSALSLGNMGIVAPISAVITAILPITVSFLQEGLPGSSQLAGFGVALVAVWVLTYSGGFSQTDRKGIFLALASGLGFGLFFICIDRASEEIVFLPLVSAKVVSVTVLLIIMAVRKQRLAPPRYQLPVVLLAGLFDAAGNGFFALASQLSRLDVAAVLASLYPASTVILAWLLLKERLYSRQWLGVAFAAGALVLISL
jgi:drug/metabolite transporter (DMT)-like permease